MSKHSLLKKLID